MLRYINLDTLELQERSDFASPITLLAVKRGDTPTIQFQFVTNGVVTEIDSGTPATFKLGAKTNDDFAGEYLIYTDAVTKAGTGTSAKYSFTPSLNTVALNDALIDGTIAETPADETERYALTGLAIGTIVRQVDTQIYWIVIDVDELDNSAGWSTDVPQIEYIDLDAELEWKIGSSITSTGTFTLRVLNDVNKGTEGMPESGPLGGGGSFVQVADTEERLELTDATAPNGTIVVQGDNTPTPATFVLTLQPSAIMDEFVDVTISRNSVSETVSWSNADGLPHSAEYIAAQIVAGWPGVVSSISRNGAVVTITLLENEKGWQWDGASDIPDMTDPVFTEAVIPFINSYVVVDDTKHGSEAAFTLISGSLTKLLQVYRSGAVSCPDSGYVAPIIYDNIPHDPEAIYDPETGFITLRAGREYVIEITISWNALTASYFQNFLRWDSLSAENDILEQGSCAATVNGPGRVYVKHTDRLASDTSFCVCVFQISGAAAPLDVALTSENRVIVYAK